MTSTTVPIIDVATATPSELVDGLCSSSCVFLINHGLTAAVLSAMLVAGQDFYARPEAEKAAVRWSGEGPWRGWQPVYDGGPQALLLERFEVALASGGAKQSRAEWATSFDQWPEEPAGLRAAWTEMYAVLHDLAGRLTAMIAEGLGLPSEDLPAWTERQHSNLVLNHYLAQIEAPEPGRVRQRAHTDIGGITLLWADGSPGAPGGLEAQIGPDGGWVPVNFPPDGALLLQAGDLLHRWSRGRIPANNHRVVNPPREPGQPQVARYSAVFFHHPDLNTWVAPALSPSDEAQALEATAALDHILWRQQRSAGWDAEDTAEDTTGAEAVNSARR